METSRKPPAAKVIPHELEHHGHTRTDDYYWLRDRDNPDTVAYLEAENDYTRDAMARVQPLEEALFEEIKGRIKQTDMSVPYRRDDYYYYTRYEEGREYPLYARKRESLENPEELMLDVNVLAEGHEFFSVGRLAVSSGQDLLAYTEDAQGRRIYTIRFRNLATGETLPDVIPEVTSNITWANDNRTLFYAKQDPETLRSCRIYRHVLGTDPSEDVLVYEETDDTFSSYVFKTKSKRFLMIVSSQTLSNEYRYLDAGDPTGAFTIFLPRERGHEHAVDHFEDRFFIHTNHEAKNFRLMSTPLDRTGKEHWEEVIPHRPDVLLEGFEVFRDHLVLEERRDGLVELRVMPWDGSQEHYLEFGEPAYLAGTNVNLEFDTTVLRYGYTSMTTPSSIYDYDMVSREKTLLKQEEVLGGFDSADYRTERLHATAGDGVRIPISLVYREGMERNGRSPLLLYGYGSYGHSLDAAFGSARLSLLDRGFVFAIAHVRGGEEMGRAWYEDGKLLRKKNTFTDFISCAEHLVGAALHVAREALRHGRQRRRHADGRGGEPASGAVQGRGGPGPVRRHRHHHARPGHSPHHRRVRRVGQPQRQGVLRLHAVVLALRQRRGQGVSPHAGDHRPARFPGAVLGAGQMGGQAARRQDRPQSAAAEDQHGRRARRRVRALQALSRDRPRIRLPAGSGGSQAVANSGGFETRLYLSSSPSSIDMAFRCLSMVV